MKKFAIIISLFLISLFFLIGKYKETSYTVVINAPIEKVWEYASDSNKAKRWSVYFDHISPFGEIEDGKVGSLRRCFRRADKTGPRWDEEVTEVIKYKYRQLRTFNLKNFSTDVVADAQFRVHQRYEKVDDKTTKLTFASELIEPISYELIKTLIPAVDETLRIFRLNLENIKAHIEQGEAYERPHPYEPNNVFDKL